MAVDKRDARALLPTYDNRRLFADLGGMKALARRMKDAGYRANWEYATVKQRVRQPSIHMDRLFEILHVHRLQGRNIRIEDYIVWNLEAKYPQPSSLPQPVPVSQARASAGI